MSDTTERPLPPPLESRTPLCSICGEETENWEDYFNCPDCDACWPIEYHHLYDGEWDPEAEQCRSTISDAAVVERCWLSAGHLGEHRTPNGSWTDEQADAPATSGSAA